MVPQSNSNTDFFLQSFIIAPDNTVSDEARKYIRSRAAQAGHRSGSRRRCSESSGAAAGSEAQNHVLSTRRREQDGTKPSGSNELTILSAVRASESSNIVPYRPPNSAKRKRKQLLKTKFGPRPPPAFTSEDQPYPSPLPSVSSSSSATSSEADLTRKSFFPQVVYPLPLTTAEDYGYPVPFEPWYPPLVENMWTWMLSSWALLSTSSPDEHLPALHWVQRTTMTEPCYFFINILSFVADKQKESHHLLSRDKVLWLETQVVRELNLAIERATSSPTTGFTPGAILTVGRIALREIMLGDREKGEKIHRPAQARMISMVGGLDAVGLPSLVVKHVRWMERLMRHVTGLGMEDVLGDEVDKREGRRKGESGNRDVQEGPSDGDFRVWEQYTGPRGLERTAAG